MNNLSKPILLVLTAITGLLWVAASYVIVQILMSFKPCNPAVDTAVACGNNSSSTVIGFFVPWFLLSALLWVLFVRLRRSGNIQKSAGKDKNNKSKLLKLWIALGMGLLITLGTLFHVDNSKLARACPPVNIGELYCNATLAPPAYCPPVNPAPTDPDYQGPVISRGWPFAYVYITSPEGICTDFATKKVVTQHNPNLKVAAFIANVLLFSTCSFVVLYLVKRKK